MQSWCVGTRVCARGFGWSTIVRRSSSIDRGSFALDTRDISTLEVCERELQVRRLTLQAAQSVFDLSADRCCGWSLLKLAAHEHVLLVTMHHIIVGWLVAGGSDSRAGGAVRRRMSEGRASPLPALAVQYADYALWQREWLQGEVLEEQLEYWKKQLAGAPRRWSCRRTGRGRR